MLSACSKWYHVLALPSQSPPCITTTIFSTTTATTTTITTSAAVHHRHRLHHHHHCLHGYPRLGQSLGIQQAAYLNHQLNLNLITKKLPLPSFPLEKLGPIVQVHPASFPLRTVKVCPSDPNIWLGSFGPGLGDYAVGLCQL